MSDTATKPLVSKAEVAKYLGISGHQVLALVLREGLPALDVGTGERRILRFNLDLVHQWAEDRTTSRITA